MLKQYLNYKNLNKKNSIIYLKKKNYKNFFLSIQKDSYNNNNFLNIINLNINKHIIKCFGFFSIELKEIKSLILFENLKTKKFSNNIKDFISFNSIEKRSLKIKNNLFCFKTKKIIFYF